MDNYIYATYFRDFVKVLVNSDFRSHISRYILTDSDLFGIHFELFCLILARISGIFKHSS